MDWTKVVIDWKICMLSLVGLMPPDWQRCIVVTNNCGDKDEKMIKVW